jgi:hypothetical protein
MKHRGEAHHLVNDEEKRWKTTPLGIRILIIYTSVLALLYLFFALTVPTNMFFGIAVFGSAAKLLNLAFLGALIIMIAGFVMKKHWAGGMAFGFFLFEILNLGISLSVRHVLLENILLMVSSIIIVLINCMILWYIYEKRDYFTDLRHFKSGQSDKFFIIGIISLAAVLILSTFAYAAAMYKPTIEITDKMIEEMNGKTMEEAVFRCSFYEGKEKDVCYLVAASAYRNAPEGICDNINNQFYKLTCAQAVML